MDADRNEKGAYESAINVTTGLIGIVGAIIAVIQEILPFATVGEKAFVVAVAILSAAVLARCSQLVMARKIDRPLVAVALPLVGLLALGYLLKTEPTAHAGSSAGSEPTGSPATGSATQPDTPRRSSVASESVPAVRHSNPRVPLSSSPTHSIDLDSLARNWDFRTSTNGDFTFYNYKVAATAPAQLAVVDPGAGYAACDAATDYVTDVDLGKYWLYDGDVITLCAQTDKKRYATLVLTIVDGDGTNYRSLMASITVWELR